MRSWLPSIVIAAGVVIGVAFGYGVQRLAAKFGIRTLGTVVTIVVSIILAVMYWLDTHTVYAILPFGGVIVGVCHRRNTFASVFGNR
jgi:hypothetical protein